MTTKKFRLFTVNLFPSRRQLWLGPGSRDRQRRDFVLILSFIWGQAVRVKAELEFAFLFEENVKYSPGVIILDVFSVTARSPAQSLIRASETSGVWKGECV